MSQKSANASNYLLFVAYEAHYNVVLENHKLIGPACLNSVKNRIETEKWVKKAKKGPFSGKDLRLGPFNGYLLLLSEF